MNTEGRAEYRLKNGGDNYGVSEHFARGVNPLARRRDHGRHYRQQIHTIGGGFDNFHFRKQPQQKYAYNGTPSDLKMYELRFSERNLRR
jgi:hypothetical protein